MLAHEISKLTQIHVASPCIKRHEHILQWTYVFIFLLQVWIGMFERRKIICGLYLNFVSNISHNVQSVLVYYFIEWCIQSYIRRCKSYTQISIWMYFEKLWFFYSFTKKKKKSLIFINDIRLMSFDLHNNFCFANGIYYPRETIHSNRFINLYF